MSISEFDEGWILGFIEGEGSFTHDLQGGYCPKSGAVYVPRFVVNQTERTTLEFLKTFFGGGHIYVRRYKGKKYWSENKSTRYDYVVRDIGTLEKIRDFCDGKLKHPLKGKQFAEWKKLFHNFVGKDGQRELARTEMNKRWSGPSYREKIRKANKKRWNKEARAKASNAMTKRWADPEERKKILLSRQREYDV